MPLVLDNEEQKITRMVDIGWILGFPINSLGHPSKDILIEVGKLNKFSKKLYWCRFC